jgi:hypothetical protein
LYDGDERSSATGDADRIRRNVDVNVTFTSTTWRKTLPGHLAAGIRYQEQRAGVTRRSRALLRVACPCCPVSAVRVSTRRIFFGREGHQTSNDRAHRLWRVERLQLPRRWPHAVSLRVGRARCRRRGSFRTRPSITERMVRPG